MKTFLCLILLSTFLYSQNLYIKGGLDISASLELNTKLRDLNLNTDDDIDIYTIPGIHFESEFTYQIIENLDIGLGIRYESEPRVQTTFESIGFYTIPVFTSIRYKIVDFEKLDFKAIGRVGFNMIGITREIIDDFNEQNGGIYYGLGLVLEEKDPSSLVWEILFSISHASFESEIGLQEIEYNYMYSKISITLGKRFSF